MELRRATPVGVGTMRYLPVTSGHAEYDARSPSSVALTAPCAQEATPDSALKRAGSAKVTRASGQTGQALGGGAC